MKKTINPNQLTFFDSLDFGASSALLTPSKDITTKKIKSKPGKDEVTLRESDNSFSKVEWSYSKRSLVEKCNLAYYYQNFGGNKRKAQNEPDKENLHFLKQLTNLYALRGKYLHLAIQQYFKAAQTGSLWSSDFLVKFAISKIRLDRDYSINYQGNSRPTGQYPPQLIHEYYYGFPDVEDLYEQIETELIEALQSFCTSPIFEEIREGGCQPDALVEKHFNLTEFPFKVRGIVDLAYTPEIDRINIIDWKTGQYSEDGNDSLQLGVYLLWALDFFGCKLEQVRIFKAFLNADKLVEFKVSDKFLDRVTAMIYQDAERLRVLESYGMQSEIEAFTPCDQPQVCFGCSFRKVCYDRN